MIRFRCNMLSDDNTPIIRDIDIVRFAQNVLYDYCPEVFNYIGKRGDELYDPGIIDPYDFSERYLGATIDVQDIYTDNENDFVAGVAVFNRQKMKVFDRDNMCTKEIVVSPNTIILDNRTVSGRSRPFEYFTIMHEAGHLMMHQQVFRRDPERILNKEGHDLSPAVIPAMCRNSSIGRGRNMLKTNEDFREHQANTFAAGMLMPPRLFIPYVQNLIREENCFDDEIMITWHVNDGSKKYRKYLEIRQETVKRFGISIRAAELQMSKYGLQAIPKEPEIYEARRRLKLYKSLLR